MVETTYRLDGCPVPFALLADTHDTDPEPILASLRAHAPVFIAHAGDFVCGQKPRLGIHMDACNNAVTLLRACAALAPTFVSIGNHEAYLSPDDLEVIRSTGVRLLDNAFVTFEAGKNRLVIGGLSSGYQTAFLRDGVPFCQSHPFPGSSPDPDLGWLARYAAADGYHVLLMHHPEYIRLIPPSIELALSGHAHGGQWRFYDLVKKQWRGVYAPNQGLFPKLTGGVVDGRQIISRGLCNSTWLPRFHNEPEIIYVEGR